MPTASGFNIAAFNLGISGTSFVGSRLVVEPGINATPWAAISLSSSLSRSWSGGLPSTNNGLPSGSSLSEATRVAYEDSVASICSRNNAAKAEARSLHAWPAGRTSFNS